MQDLRDNDIGGVNDAEDPPSSVTQQLESLARFPSENPNPVLRIAGDGAITYANAAASDLLETITEPGGKRLISHWCARMAQTLSAGCAEEIEIAVGARLFGMSVVPVPDQGYVNVYARDITERHQAEAALRKREEELRHLVQHLHAGVVVHAPDTSILLSNAQASRLLGLSEDQMMGKTAIDPAWSFLHEDRTPMPLEEYPVNRVLASKEPVKNLVVGVNRPATADCVWVLVNAFPELDSEEQIAQVVVTFIDITERKRIEQALREHQEFTETALDAQVDTFFLFEPATGKAVRWNKSFRDVSGYSDEEIARLPAPETYYSKEDVERTRCCVSSTLEADSGTIELELICKDGRRVPTEYRVSVIRDQAGEPRYLVSIGRDISARKHMEDQLRQAQKLEAVGQLAGGLAHDFNNLLTGMMGYTELTRSNLPPDHEVQPWLAEIEAQTKRSASLTRKLLAFARRQTIAPIELDLNDAVAAILKMLHRLIGEDIELVWIPGSQLWPVKVDPGQIDQILTNLCVNARDAIGGVGNITIETKNTTLDAEYCTQHADAVPGPHVMLCVTDTGTGMTPETIEHAFEPFFTTKGSGLGTGLGLATVYGIVRQNGGHVNVYSEEGRGCAFRIYLPRSEGQTEDLPAKRAESVQTGGDETVLLVEDEDAVRVTACTFLQNMGYTVLSAGSPECAIRLCREHEGDLHLLLTDVVMPGMNGRDLAQTLHEQRPGMKCLFMSGYTADVIAHRGVLEEDVDFLPKPFNRNELARKVREVLDRHVPKEA
jgi:two-component system cell cycle sensor histidine kinase/response regulator CckA